MKKYLFLIAALILIPLIAYAATDSIPLDYYNRYHQTDYAYAVTLTPSATTGSITLTLGSGNWNSNTRIQAGCWVEGDIGRATLTGTPAAQTGIAATVDLDFPDTDPIASGNWTLHCLNVNGKKLSLSSPTYSFEDCGTVDYDSKTYNTIVIGTQCWFRDNLDTGTKISGNMEQTDNHTVEKYCYNNSSVCGDNGGLYQWGEAMDYSTTEGAQGLCPSGWHIPTNAEWYVLEDYLKAGTCSSTRTGGECGPAGRGMKEGGYSGFDAPLNGYYTIGDTYTQKGNRGYFWTSSVTGTEAWYRSFSADTTTVSRLKYAQVGGLSVRCLKD